MDKKILWIVLVCIFRSTLSQFTNGPPTGGPPTSGPPTSGPSDPTGGPTGGTAGCNADEFKCDTTDECFTSAWKCDGIVDCSDESDESDCPATGPPTGGPPTGGPPTGVPPCGGGPTGGPTGGPAGCNADEFKCDTTDQCFTIGWKCDGIVDCSDNSDEKDCPVTNGPPTGSPPTSGPSGCGSDSSKCDGYADCADGSDEQGCDTFTCPANKEKCGDGQKDKLICVLKSAFCDGYQDCPDGGDEKEDTCQARTCDAEEVRCPEGSCLPASAKCNGWPECSNGADEVGCTGCPGSGKRCADGKMCVEKSAFCDGMLDCPDQSDEANCGGAPSKRSTLYRRFERLHQLRSREKRSAPKTVAQRALKAMEDARHKRDRSALNRRHMVTSRRQSRTDIRGLQSIRMTRRRQQRRSHQG